MRSEMDDFAPLYLSSLQSIRCGIGEGWYVIDGYGTPRSGPFLSRESCMTDIRSGDMKGIVLAGIRS
jgi:hypothetical protein